MNHLKATLRARIIDLARQGYSDYDIRDATGCARTTIQRVRRAEGIPPHPMNLGRGKKRHVFLAEKARKASPLAEQHRRVSDIREYWLRVDPTLRAVSRSAATRPLSPHPPYARRAAS